MVALTYFSEAIVWHKSIDSLLSRGDCYLDNAQYNDAMADYNAAIEIDPHSDLVRSKKAHLYNYLGTNLYLVEKFVEADSEFSKALLFSPADAKIYLNRAKTRIRLKRYVEAVEDIVYAFAYDNTDKEVHALAKDYAPRLISK